MTTPINSIAGRRLVLEGVPKIGYHKHLSPFPGSLHAWLEYMGDPVDYDYLMGVTGACFRRTWNRDDGGNVDLMYFHPEPHTRVLNALGYSWRVVMRGDRQAMLSAVQESVSSGKPLLAFGIIGPPEAGLVTGYDEGGDVLIGRSYFQDMPDHRGSAVVEPTGYYRRSDWFEETESHSGCAAIVVEAKGRRPAERDVLVSTLRWAIDLERTPLRPNIPDHVCGLTAYEAWANGLAIDADYPADNAEVLGIRTMIMGDQAVMLDERHNAARYLRGMAEVAPEAADALRAAAGLFDETAYQMDGIWLWGNNMGPGVGRALVDPVTRRGIAAHVRVAREKEARAVDHLESALATLTL